MKMSGRKAPYTAIGITRLRCIRCGERARYQWNVCADGNVWRPICDKCDIALNRMVLRFFKFPNWQPLITKYKKRRAAPVQGEQK